MKSSLKRLILIRHAHRDTEDRMRDNGLSEKGQKQVQRLIKFAVDRLDGEDPVFLSSPKKRCHETLAPIAKQASKKLEIDDRLAEQGPAENQALYLARVDEFLDSWKYEGAPLTVVCSHGDWIPVVVQHLTGAKVGLKKAGWIEIEFVGTPGGAGEAFLTWIVQKV